MPNSVSLTDGTTTIALSSGGCFLTNYVPSSPELDGTGNYRAVTETVEFFISDSTIAAVQSKVGSIERLLQDAVRAQNDECAPVYILFQTGADAAAWRSEIISFRLLMGEDASVNLFQQRMDCRLILTRAHYWEGTEVELQLSTSNQAAATGGRTIKNHDDAGAGDDNWVQIAAAQVAGSLPAGVRVQLQNTSGAARTWEKLYVAHNALSDPANFPHILEAEARISGGTVQTNAAASGGSELQFTLADSSITFTWTLSASLLQKASGRPFRLLGAVNGAGGSPTIIGTATAEIRSAAGSVTLWRGDTVSMPTVTGLVDLGQLALPPGGFSSSYGALRLSITFSGTGSWTLDFLQLTPTDGLALLSCVYSVANNEYVVLDSIEGRHYSMNGVDQLPYVVAAGSRILLHPNRLQRIVVLASSPEGGMAIGDTFVVRVWCRPRRLSV